MARLLTVISALTLRADIRRTRWHVGYVPLSDVPQQIASSSITFVGPTSHNRRVISGNISAFDNGLALWPCPIITSNGPGSALFANSVGSSPIVPEMTV